MIVDDKLLEYLLAFYEYKSLSKASEVLHISQPSLSKGMQKLESQLGIRIFDRKANKISLNEAGYTILPYVSDIIEMNKKLFKIAKEIKEEEASISVGFTAPGPIYRFSNFFFSNPERLRVVTKTDKEDALIKGITNNTYDLVFINNFISNRDFICRKVMTERLYVSLPPTHFLSGVKSGVHWSDIDGQSFLLFNYTGYWEEILEKNLKKSRFLRSSNMEELKEIVEYSTIPSFLTDITIKSNASDGRINIPILDADASLDFYALCKPTNEKILNLLR